MAEKKNAVNRGPKCGVAAGIHIKQSAQGIKDIEYSNFKRKKDNMDKSKRTENILKSTK